MKLAALAFLLVASSLHGEELELGFYSMFPDAGSRQAGVIFELEAKADRSMWCDKDRNFDLGLGKITGKIPEESRSPIELKFDEIKGFLQSERHKEIVVVWFDKTVMWNEQEVISKRVAEVTKQMQEVGYKRVVVLGAAGSGVHYVADTNLKAKSAE